MFRAPAAIAVRLLAGLLTLAVLLTASPLPLIQSAVAAAPVGEEADADVETLSSACPRRAAGAGGPPFAASPPTHVYANRLASGSVRSAARAAAGSPGRGALRPHPRC
ncbi:hypothetical protein [Urbifossiella limnaea]|uniref:Uncharacterized protein n=1 Tax=Urbifossiella limnaea TaxID=2528023 RepID=A0A517XYU7_9BACT|nr:hypothetical protein [Urbifossiella limnaea]QDU22682.1 hypothetical protein ETAA1_46660 [Urbifossiella limnaea]